jgi:quercetin dioxygenase-like cupin family protein
VHPRPVRRGGVTWVRLAGNATGMRAYKQVLPVGSPAAEPRDLCRHEGYEWVYVLDGELGLTLGDRTHVLTTGEAAEFDTQVPHAYVNLGNAPLELLLIVGEQGARIHLRVRDDASVPNTIPDE